MTLKEQLESARKAYHNLMIGQSARVVVDGSDGSRMEFTAARKADLYAYIQELELRLAQSGASPITQPTNGPAGFVF